MSRTFSAGAVRQFFSPDADDPYILLLTITAPNDVPGADTLRLANSWTTRLTSYETDESMTVYGVTSNGNDFIFIPFELSLPTQDDAAPRATLRIHDITREVMPLIRGLSGTPAVTLQVVLASAPNTVELSFPGLIMRSISYDRDTIEGELTADDLASEPFPAHTFTPNWFPGLF